MNPDTKLPGTSHAGQAEPQGRENLIFILGDQEYGIDILRVQEIRGYDPRNITQIVDMPDFIKGITNLRGAIVPIIDLRLKFKLQHVAYNEQTVVVILNVHDRVVGIVVDGVSDVIHLPPHQIRPAPHFGTAPSAQYLLGIGTVDDRMLVLVDIEKLMSHEDIERVDCALA